MKKLSLAILIFLIPCCGLFMACQTKTNDFIRELNTTSDFELVFLENTGTRDLSGFNYLPMSGGSVYYNAKYGLVDEEKAPGVYYTVTAYPDYTDGGVFVTSITCLDPDFKILGKKMKDYTGEKMRELLSQYGFAEFVDGADPANDFSVTSHRVTVAFSAKQSFRVSYEVTNRTNMVF